MVSAHSTHLGASVPDTVLARQNERLFGGVQPRIMVQMPPSLMHARPTAASPTATKPRSVQSHGHFKQRPSCRYMLFLHCLQVHGYPGMKSLHAPSTSRSVQCVVVVSVAEVVVVVIVRVVTVAVVAVRVVAVRLVVVAVAVVAVAVVVVVVAVVAVAVVVVAEDVVWVSVAVVVVVELVDDVDSSSPSRQRVLSTK